MAKKSQQKNREARDVPVHTRLSASEVRDLDAYAESRTWTRSTAAQQLLRKALVDVTRATA